MSESRVLIEIGGTQLRFIQLGPQQQLADGQVEQFAYPHKAGLRAWLQAKAAAHPMRILAAVAAPVVHDRGMACATLPARRLMLTAGELAQWLGGTEALVYNDLQAAAMGLALLIPEQRRLLCGRPTEPNAEPELLLNLGTGIGVSLLINSGAASQALASEAGMMDFRPPDVDDALARALQGDFQRSHCALYVHPQSVLQLLKQLQHPCAAGGLEAVMAQRDEPAVASALQRYSLWLGHYAGNLTLSFAAWGGLNFCGGAFECIREGINWSTFAQGYCVARSHRARLEQVPIWAVEHPQLTLLGLDRLAATAPG